MPKFKFHVLWAAANGVHRNSLAKSCIFSGISLAHLSTALKNRPDVFASPSLLWLACGFRRCKY